MTKFYATFVFLFAFLEVNGIQVLLTKNDKPYCFNFQADPHTVLTLDYLVTGVNPENVVFEATQNGKIIS